MSKLAFERKWVFDPEKAWDHLRRNWITPEGHDVVTPGKEPCASCVTRMNHDYRTVCGCPPTVDTRCSECDRRRVHCVAIPAFLKGAAQAISIFAAEVVANDGIDMVSLQDPPNREIMHHGRLRATLRRVETLLATCIREEEDEWAQPDLTPMERAAQANEQLVAMTAIVTEMSVRAPTNNPMTEEEYQARIRATAETPFRESAHLHQLDKALTVAQSHDFYQKLPVGERNWAKTWHESGQDWRRSFLGFSRLWDGQYGERLINSLALPPVGLVEKKDVENPRVRTPRKRRRDEGGEEDRNVRQRQGPREQAEVEAAEPGEDEEEEEETEDESDDEEDESDDEGDEEESDDEGESESEGEDDEEEAEEDAEEAAEGAEEEAEEAAEEAEEEAEEQAEEVVDAAPETPQRRFNLRPRGPRS
ncbi:hypothetical protein GGR50DRAFT_702259 [Xylaria sp. CBS 124048]|nr:hypothetical protein GGR50DRAFT_702259 [Xylaria sp. CBS 124048]